MSNLKRSLIILNKVASYIGLCTKAGRSTSGEFAVEQAIKDGKAFIVIMATDASENTKKKFRDKCQYRNVPLIEWGDKYTLAKTVGKEVRAVVAILDEGFAQNILKNLEVI